MPEIGRFLGSLFLTGVALFCAAKGVLAYLAEPRPLLDSLIPPAAVLVLAPAAVAYLAFQGARAKRTLRVTIDPGQSPEEAVRHEMGHASVGLARGGTIGRAEVRPDGSGYVDVRLPADATSADKIALSLGGAHAEGVSIYSPQCRGDRSNIEAELGNVPWGERSATRREAERLSRSAVNAWLIPGQVAAMGRALRRTGRYH